MSEYKKRQTWGLPDCMENKIDEALSRKSIRPEDAVQKAIEELARDIAIIEPNAEDWDWWVGYLLEQLESETKSIGERDQFSKLLEGLRNDIGI